MNSRGFSIIEVVVVVVVIAVIVTSAYLFINRPGSNDQAVDSTPKTYQSNQDLEVAATELESTNIDAELDSLLQELDQEAAAF